MHTRHSVVVAERHHLSLKHLERGGEQQPSGEINEGERYGTKLITEMSFPKEKELIPRAAKHGGESAKS